jgi:hypothetical protein
VSVPKQRPTIQINNRPLDYVTDEAWAALLDANETDPQRPRVLLRGDQLVEVVGETDGEAVSLRRFSDVTLKTRLSRVATFVRVTRNSETVVFPPQDVTRALLSFGADRDVERKPPRVARVTDVPVFDSEGDLITTPGYHRSGIYFSPAPGLEDIQVPTNPTAEDVQLATHFLSHEYLGDFPFVEQADRAAALGLLLLPFMRELIDGGTPLHDIEAPEPGTGKSLLARALLFPGCGGAPTVPPTDADEEQRKRITTFLLQGKSAVILDNLEGQLDSGPLAAALTSDVWEERLLGGNEWVSLPVRNVWVATANNLQLSEQMARRTIPIFIDAQVEEPFRREGFRHPNLLTWAESKRRLLVTAALTLIQNWVAASRDEDRGALLGTQVFGSFERWAQVVGGVLHEAGVPGHLENHGKLMTQATADRTDLAAFLTAWHATRGSEPLTSAELAQLCQQPGALLYGALPTELEEHRSRGRLGRQLGYYLRRQRGRVAGGLCIDRIESSQKWFVRST